MKGDGFLFIWLCQTYGKFMYQSCVVNCTNGDIYVQNIKILLCYTTAILINICSTVHVSSSRTVDEI